MVAHRLLLGLELLVLAAPVTLLFAFGAPEFVEGSYASCGLVVPVGRMVLCLLAATALLSGWYLSIRFIVAGRISTAGLGSALWVAMLAGLAVAAVAWVDHYVPSGNPYGCLDVFRVTARPFGFGLVLLVPMAHLAFLELRARRSDAD